MTAKDSTGDRDVDTDLTVVAGFLARRDISDPVAAKTVEPFDVLVLAGSSVLPAPAVAASAMHAGVANKLVISGGIGHSTPYLVDALRAHATYRSIATEGRSEARMLADLLRDHCGIPDSVLMLEEHSANCGENAVFTRRLLDERGLDVRSLLLVQDPTMQRRSHAAFERAWQDRPGFRLISFAPFVPRVADGVVSCEPGGSPAWPFERFVSLVLGEIRRLRDDESGYGPRGANFIDHVEIPSVVLKAYERLALRFPAAVRG